MYYNNIEGFTEMKDNEKLELLKSIVEKVFYNAVKSKKNVV